MRENGAVVRRGRWLLATVGGVGLLLVGSWYLWPFLALAFMEQPCVCSLDALLRRGGPGRRAFVRQIAREPEVWRQGSLLSLGLGWEERERPGPRLTEADIAHLRALDSNLFYLALICHYGGTPDVRKWGAVPEAAMHWILPRLYELQGWEYRGRIGRAVYLCLCDLPDAEALGILLGLDSLISVADLENLRGTSAGTFCHLTQLVHITGGRLVRALAASQDPHGLWHEWAEKYGAKLAFQWTTYVLLRQHVIELGESEPPMGYLQRAYEGTLSRGDIEFLLARARTWKTMADMGL